MGGMIRGIGYGDKWTARPRIEYQSGEVIPPPVFGRHLGFGHGEEEQHREGCQMFSKRWIEDRE